MITITDKPIPKELQDFSFIQSDNIIYKILPGGIREATDYKPFSTMSIEAKSLAEQMNKLDLSAEGKPRDSPEWQKGKTEYESIIRNIGFILPRGLKLVIGYLNENGWIVYNKFFHNKIEEEIKRGTKNGNSK